MATFVHLAPESRIAADAPQRNQPPSQSVERTPRWYLRRARYPQFLRLAPVAARVEAPGPRFHRGRLLPHPRRGAGLGRPLQPSSQHHDGGPSRGRVFDGRELRRLGGHHSTSDQCQGDPPGAFAAASGGLAILPRRKWEAPFCTCKYCTRGEYGARGVRERLEGPDVLRWRQTRAWTPRSVRLKPDLRITSGESRLYLRENQPVLG